MYHIHYINFQYEFKHFKFITSFNNNLIVLYELGRGPYGLTDQKLQRCEIN